ncbi:MAG: NAD-dependent epimerase/dehydratase family protein, partial [Acidobacteriota bacterium]
MTALVTGVAGFLGSSLAEVLVDQGQDILGIDCFLEYYPREVKTRNLQSLRKSGRFHLIEAPLQEVDLKPLVSRAEVVFHLAAQAGVRASWGRDFSIYTNNNILATQRLLEAAVGQKLQAFVYASSSSVYGDGVTLPTREDVRLRPVSPYGVTKLAAEMLCHSYFVNHG